MKKFPVNGIVTNLRTKTQITRPCCKKSQTSSRKGKISSCSPLPVSGNRKEVVVVGERNIACVVILPQRPSYLDFFYQPETCSSVSVHTTLEKFENAALFLRLGGLPSTLTCHENGVCRKRSSNRRNLKTLALRFSERTENILKAELQFRKRLCQDNHVIFLPEISSNTNPK